MSWAQIDVALKEKRHELCLTGKEYNVHLEKNGLDANLFRITSLNYLSIHDTSLHTIPDGISLLVNLQTLSLHSNRIAAIPAGLQKLNKLKVLDLSRNAIEAIHMSFDGLDALVTINLSNNKLETFPGITKNAKVQVVDLSHNQLKAFPNIYSASLVNLSDVKLNHNQISEIPWDIDGLTCLKNFDISANKIMVVPGSLTACGKLKDVNLKENPISDRRLLKLIDQCRTKQILDYVKQHSASKPGSQAAPAGQGDKNKKKGGGKRRTTSETSNKSEDNSDKLKLKVKHSSDESLRIVIKDDVKSVRANIVCCLLHGIAFNEDLFRKFIQLQNKLHETICDKRNVATIATHDAKNLIDSKLVYTALKPKELMIRPLNRQQAMSGHDLFNKLQQEAENLRKEKKRNVYSGIHKYLYLLEGKAVYPCLIRQGAAETETVDEVISFPPITNSDISKISQDSTSLLLEVTSNANPPLTRKIMDTLIQETLVLFGKDLIVEQIRITDVEGNLKSVYPSKTDLNFEPSCNIHISRD